MEEIEFIELEGNEYMIVKELVIDGTTYIHLAKPEDIEDFCIRKIQTIDGEEMIVGLDDFDEFNMALNVFANKHIEEIEEKEN